MVRLISATHAEDSSRSFQRRARPPPGRRTRAISVERRRRIEPVEGLGDRDDVDRLVGQRDRLGRAGDRVDLRQDGLELPPHPLDGLDGEHVGARLDEPAGELAGAGREVAHLDPRTDPELADEQGDGLVGVAGAGQLVGRRAGLEAAGGDVVDVHQATRSASAGRSCSSTAAAQSA